MRKLFLFAVSIFLLKTIPVPAQGILNKAKDKIKQRGDSKVDQTIDKTIDQTEGSIGKKDGDGNGQGSETKTGGNSSADKNDNNSKPAQEEPKDDIVAYGKYDFVPGDKIIFEDKVEGETPGEFPSKWNLTKGKIEIATINGQQVIAFLEGNYASIYPLINMEGDYLPDVFSLEFDHYVKSGGYTQMAVSLANEKEGNTEELGKLSGWALTTGVDGAAGGAQGSYPSSEQYYNKWHHIAVSFNKGNIKIYADEHRLCNLPRSEGNPHGISFGCIGSEENTIFIKNIRIAAGGGDLYKRVSTDGKIVTHGILFDVNKYTLRPESMGTLNEISKGMKDNPQVKFEIGGHTDADGSDDANLKLSQARATAVKEQLVKMGIDASRLIPKGYGESKPIDNSTTPEGKANNRRVEFVKN